MATPAPPPRRVGDHAAGRRGTLRPVNFLL
ncbi:MAG: hypothetical protein QOK14_1687, partial [Frankiaceae bacterium]|nr:hypothetical protein [Frankiaceae bacterium]